MELFDLCILFMLEWLYEPICEKFGKLVAATVIIVVAACILLVIVLIFIRIQRQ